MDKKYTKDHEWVLPAEGGLWQIGITDHAQNQLGDIVYVELPDPGTQRQRGMRMAVIESVKAVADVYAPADGMVEAVNDTLDDAPEQLNENAEQAWIVSFRPDDPAVYDTLLDAAAYQALLAEQN